MDANELDGLWDRFDGWLQREIDDGGQWSASGNFRTALDAYIDARIVLMLSQPEKIEALMLKLGKGK